jgi:tetratricopeptide (TPR) repeat protein
MDASPAVIAACQSAWLEGDGRTILSHVLIPPTGDATDLEAANPDVLGWAARAALLIGARQELERIVRALPKSFARALFEGAMADEAEKPLEAEATYRSALSLANDDEDRYQALIRLARLGVHPLPIDPESLDISEDRRAIITASALSARNETEEAVRVLRPHRRRSLAAATALANCYQRGGDLEGAISILQEGAERFGAWDLVVDAMELASQAHMWDDATQLALDALSRLRESSSIASHVRRRLIDIYSRRADWVEMERQARAELRARPVDPLARWALVIALYNQNRRDLAWQAITEADSIEPLDSYQARVKISLIAANNRTSGGISDVLDLSDAFPDDHDVRAMAMHVAHLLTTDLKLPAGVGERIRQQTQDFLVRFPDSEAFRAISASNPEALLRRMHDDLLIANQQTFKLIRGVQRGQLPYGIAVLGRSIPYSLALAARAAGPLFGIAGAPEIDAEDYRAAIDALDGAVVTEASTLSVIAGHSRLRDLVIASFSAVEISDVSVFDLNLASDQVILQPAMVFVVDPVTGADRFEVPDPDDAARLAGLVRSMAEVASGLRQVPCRSLKEFPELDLAAHGAWLSPIEIGTKETRFVYSDDVVIRQLARGKGLRAFGTYALLQALTSQRGLDPDQLSAHLKALFGTQLVDMPEATGFINEAIDAKTWTSPAALAAAARPAIWSDPSGGLRFYTEIFRRVKDGDKDRLPLWLHAALGGAANLPPETLATFLSEVLVTAMLVSADSAEIVPGLVEAARRRASEFQILDPFPQAIRTLITAAEAELAPADAAQYVLAMIASLDGVDRNLAMGIISDPRQRMG